MTLSTVVACVDASPHVAATLSAARHLATLLGAKLRVVHVQEPVSGIVSALMGKERLQRAEAKAREEVEKALAAAAPGAPLPPLETLHGDPGDVLVGLTNAESLLVVGVHGGGFASYGSTARRVVRGAAGSILAVQERRARGAYKSILVALDTSEASRKALAFASDVVSREQGTLEAIHVYEAPTRGLLDLLDDEKEAAALGEKLRAEAAERLRPMLSTVMPAPKLELVDGFHPARRIAPFAQLEGHDLIVIGSRIDPHRRDMVLGSVADELISLATQDVLVVKSEV